MEPQKRIAAIHDISCAGRCSLTVALPILSAFGIETNVIPTAILSTQTGGFEHYTYRDLSEDILAIARHWKSLDRQFNAIYTGFLGSFRQLELVSQIIQILWKENTLIYIDPVMADGGTLYKTFDRSFVDGMREFCRKADVITPNITEALLLLNRPYREGPYEISYITEILWALSELGPEKVVLTGVYSDTKHLGAAAIDRKDASVVTAFSETVPGIFHGAGDVFASVFLGKLIRGLSLEQALSETVDFTARCIRTTSGREADTRFGLEFETHLGLLIPGGIE